MAMHVEHLPDHIDDLIRAGPLAVSPQVASQCWLHGRALNLTARQVRMLAMLLRARGALLSRDDLYEGSTGRELPMKSRAVDMDLWRIRKELGPYGDAIRAVRKVGYAFDAALMRQE